MKIYCMNCGEDYELCYKDDDKIRFKVMDCDSSFVAGELETQCPKCKEWHTKSNAYFDRVGAEVVDCDLEIDSCNFMMGVQY